MMQGLMGRAVAVSMVMMLASPVLAKDGRIDKVEDRIDRAENAIDDASEVLRGHDRSPEAEASTHLWRGALPTKLDAGEHVVEVRAFDRWRGEQRATTTYRLEEAPPR